MTPGDILCNAPCDAQVKAAHKREVDALKEQIDELRQTRDLWRKRADELVAKCNEQHAALKSAAPGNAAALREALVAVKKSIDGIGASSLDGDPEIIIMSLTQVCARLSARIERALAKPPRNCERFKTKEEAEIEFMMSDELPRDNGDTEMRAWMCRFIDWLFAPATDQKGGAK